MVAHCTNLYELGEKLTKLINTKLKEVDTIKYLQKLNKNSLDFNMGSDFYISEEDAKMEAITFVKYLDLLFDEI